MGELELDRGGRGEGEAGQEDEGDQCEHHGQWSGGIWRKQLFAELHNNGTSWTALNVRDGDIWPAGQKYCDVDVIVVQRTCLPGRKDNLQAKVSEEV